MPDKNQIGFPFIILQSVDSTNNYATALAHEGMAQHGTTVFTYEQTKGKGQRNKAWIASKNENILLSIIIKPYEGLLPNFVFSMAMALGAHQFFNKHAANETYIKWPNDIYWNDRKAGGILIENIFKGHQWKYSIVGIGLNINQTSFDQIETKAVSLKQITGNTYDIIHMAKELCTSLNEYYLILIDDPQMIITNYHNHLYKINETVRLKKESRIFNAYIKGVSKNGQLITMHTMEEMFDVGEVEWLF